MLRKVKRKIKGLLRRFKNLLRKFKENQNRLVIVKKSALNNGLIQSTYKVKVLTIREICVLLDIRIPDSLKEFASTPVSETPLFEYLENAEKLKKNIRRRKDFRLLYYKSLVELAKEFKDRYTKSVLVAHTDEELLQMYIQWQYTYLPIGFSYKDYFDFRLYEKSIEEARKFVDRAYKQRIIKACSTREDKELCRDKALFNQRLSDYIKRDYLDTTKCTLEEFQAFVGKHPKFFAKPLRGGQGQEAGIVTSTKEDAVELFRQYQNFDYVRGNGMIVEELIKQHADLAKLNSSTVNTIRVMTMYPLDLEPFVTFAGVRIGRAGMAVDNISSGGMTATIDLSTGKIMTDAVDGSDRHYEKHPDSGIVFKDYQIPHWDKVMTSAVEAAKKIPEIRSIGWDVSITQHGDVEFVEGNQGANFRIVQIADQVGKKHLYKEHIEKIVEKRRAEGTLPLSLR